MNSKGFTLLELILVMAIIALAVAFIAPRIGSNSAGQFKAQLSDAVAAINYARRMAIVTGKPVAATLYKKQESAAGGVPEKNHKNKQKGDWVGKGIDLRRSGTNALQEDSEIYYRITFFPEGGSTGGELILDDGQFHAKITVEPLTGKVTSTMQLAAQ